MLTENGMLHKMVFFPLYGLYVYSLSLSSFEFFCCSLLFDMILFSLSPEKKNSKRTSSLTGTEGQNSNN